MSDEETSKDRRPPGLQSRADCGGASDGTSTSPKYMFFILCHPRRKRRSGVDGELLHGQVSKGLGTHHRSRQGGSRQTSERPRNSSSFPQGLQGQAVRAQGGTHLLLNSRTPPRAGITASEDDGG